MLIGIEGAAFSLSPVQECFVFTTAKEEVLVVLGSRAMGGCLQPVSHLPCQPTSCLIYILVIRKIRFERLRRKNVLQRERYYFSEWIHFTENEFGNRKFRRRKKLTLLTATLRGFKLNLLLERFSFLHENNLRNKLVC